MVVLEVAVRPAWPSEPPRSAGPGGLLRIRGNVVTRAMPSGAVAHAAWRDQEVLLKAEGASAEDAEDALTRMRLCEQLIDTQAAGDIVWALVHELRRRHASGTWMAPEPDALDNPPALVRAGLAPARARTLARVSRAVARGDIDPGSPDRARLAAILGVGTWTLAHLDLFGRGIYDVPLQADVGMRNAYARMAGRRTGSVTEDEFAEVLDRYRPWQGLAAMYMVHVGWRSGGRWAESPHALRRR
jgi:hypothetical protein